LTRSGSILNMLIHSVAMELGESGVRVNCICPGGLATPIFGKSMGLSPDRADEVIPPMKAVLEKFPPIKRTGMPDDIARAALWLASDESGFVNGHALVVGGGLIGGRLWSEVQQRREMFRTTLGLT
jgi:NAD(P)-dependent dehydrogenase (short-subunit alcohol dehydrogenase family)